jgi:hypothetical protein
MFPIWYLLLDESQVQDRIAVIPNHICLLNEYRGKLRTDSSQQKNGKMSDDIHHQSPHILLLDFPFFADFAVFFFAAIFSYIKMDHI